MRVLIIALLAYATNVALPASAATNLILNGSFEKGFAHFARSSGTTEFNPAVVIKYNNAAAYGTNGGAYGEAIPTDQIANLGGDATGTHAAYFVDDDAVNESIAQNTHLAIGHYAIGFDAYLPFNGAANPFDAAFVGKILNATVANFTVSSTAAGIWLHYSGVANITKAGNYKTSFVYSTPGLGAAKDVVIDKVYAIATTAPSTVDVPETTTVPEVASWVMMIAGFGLVGASLRRTRAEIVSA